MGFLRAAACWLGLVDLGWIRVRGLEVEVVISGDKRRVHRLAMLVQAELVRMARKDAARSEPANSKEPSAVVPVAIDERDSPYVVANRVLRGRPGFAPSARPLRARPRAPSRVSADAETEQLGSVGLLEITEQ